MEHALSTAGRFSVIVATAPSRVNRTGDSSVTSASYGAGNDGTVAPSRGSGRDGSGFRQGRMPDIYVVRGGGGCRTGDPTAVPRTDPVAALHRSSPKEPAAPG